MRFENYLRMHRSARTIIGNSSAGVREAPYFGVPVVNLGTRQSNRAESPLILNANFEFKEIKAAVEKAMRFPRVPSFEFGEQGSASRFLEAISSRGLWETRQQKQFRD
jgi:UDP-N-acetylglucosamine 2-epimerase (hydrolysing)